MADEQKAPVEVSAKLQKVIDEVAKLTVLELADLVKALEDKFGVSAAAPMAIAAPNGGGDSAEAAEKKTEFDVVITAAGANKIASIKAVRALKPDLGLKEAKELVEAAPKVVLEKVSTDDAEAAKKTLEEAGATVELK